LDILVDHLANVLGVLVALAFPQLFVE